MLEVVSFLPLLLILGSTTTQADQINWNGQDWAMNCDFPGGSLKNVKSKSHSCGPICEDTENCTHFTWTADNDQNGTCSLKSGSVSKDDAVFQPRLASGNSICGVVLIVVIWQGNWAFRCTFTGNDLSNVRSVSSKCGPICEETDGCSHFAWTNLNRGTCWLKYGEVTKDDAIVKQGEGAVCGLSLTPPVPFEKHHSENCEFPGENLLKKKTPSVLCWQHCQDTRDCTHFSWNNNNGGTCSLKKGKASMDNAVSVSGNGAICGVLTPKPETETSTTITESPLKRNKLGIVYDASHYGSIESSEVAVRSDFQKMSQHFSVVRTMQVNYQGVDLSSLAAEFGLKIYLGVEIADDDETFQKELEAAIGAASHFPDTVSALIVGEGSIGKGKFSAMEIRDRINTVKVSLKEAANMDGQVAVGTAQPDYVWLSDDEDIIYLAAESDVIGVNIFPFSAFPDNPVKGISEFWSELTNRFSETEKISITATGFPTKGQAFSNGAQPTLNDSISFFRALNSWNPEPAIMNPVFWYKAFDDDSSAVASRDGSSSFQFGIFFSNGTSKSNEYIS